MEVLTSMERCVHCRLELVRQDLHGWRDAWGNLFCPIPHQHHRHALLREMGPVQLEEWLDAAEPAED